MSGVEGTQIAATSDEKDNKKQGHIYCGFCCDMRRAVMIVNILSVVNVFFQIITIAGFSRATKTQNPGEYDVLVQVERAFAGVFIMGIIGTLFSMGAFYGAFKYKVIPVIVQAVYTIIYWFSVNIMMLRASQNHDSFKFGWVNWVSSLVITLLFLYPHAMLITELRSGIMSAETYAREKQSCCCV